MMEYLEPISYSGPQNETIRFCSDDRQIGYSLWWYHLADEPELLTCSKCYKDYIANTHLASRFQRTKRPEGSISQCSFFRPRVKEVLWPQALARNDLSPMLRFMKTRSQMPPCKGAEPNGTDNPSRWYSLAGQEVPNFVACRTCVEDYVGGTWFESRFTPVSPQDVGADWYCDMRSGTATSKAAVHMAKTNDWARFVSLASRRMELPTCEGQPLAPGAVTWYSFSHKESPVRICETCYLDKLAFDEFGPQFVVCPASEEDEEQYSQDASNAWACDLADSNVPMVFLHESAAARKNFDLFVNLTEEIVQRPPCTANGIIGGQWWTIRGGDPAQYCICHACYLGVFQSGGLEKFMSALPSPTTDEQPEAKVCDFNVSSNRFAEKLGKFAEALDKGTFDCYADYVKKWAAVPPCPTTKALEGGRWWGYREALCCEECYHGFVATTPVAAFLDIKAVFDSRAQICQMWSPRMRRMWLAVCDSGRPGTPAVDAALGEFRAFGAHRQQVWMQTLPQIEYMEKMQLMNVQMALHQGLLSTQYSIMNTQAVLGGLSDGYLHGNNSLGWYQTENGVKAAQLQNSMRAGLANSTNGDQAQQTLQMRLRWSEVE